MDAGLVHCNADRKDATVRDKIKLLHVEKRQIYQIQSWKTVCVNISTQEDTDTEHIHSKLKSKLTCHLM